MIKRSKKKPFLERRLMTLTDEPLVLVVTGIHWFTKFSSLMISQVLLFCYFQCYFISILLSSFHANGQLISSIIALLVPSSTIFWLFFSLVFTNFLRYWSFIFLLFSAATSFYFHFHVSTLMVSCFSILASSVPSSTILLTLFLSLVFNVVALQRQIPS